MSETMLLSSEYIVIDKTGKLSKIAKEANNLYNASLYQARQAFFKTQDSIDLRSIGLNV